MCKCQSNDLLKAETMRQFTLLLAVLHAHFTLGFKGI